MEGFLARVNETHGSMVGWAETAGLDVGVVKSLSDKLLD